MRNDDGDHRYFYHEFKGKRTGCYTFTSHGSGYNDYNETLLVRMKKPLHLDRLKEVCDLCSCPMDGETYNQILRTKGLITDT